MRRKATPPQHSSKKRATRTLSSRPPKTLSSKALIPLGYKLYCLQDESEEGLITLAINQKKGDSTTQSKMGDTLVDKHGQFRVFTVYAFRQKELMEKGYYNHGNKVTEEQLKADILSLVTTHTCITRMRINHGFKQLLWKFVVDCPSFSYLRAPSPTIKEMDRITGEISSSSIDTRQKLYIGVWEKLVNSRDNFEEALKPFIVRERLIRCIKVARYEQEFKRKFKDIGLDPVLEEFIRQHILRRVERVQKEWRFLWYRDKNLMSELADELMAKFKV